MGSIFSALFGSSAPKVATAPAQKKVESESVKNSAQQKALAVARSQLFQTEGGALGEEVEQVQKRSTLFGN